MAGIKQVQRVLSVVVKAQNYLDEFNIGDIFGQRRVIHDVDEQTRGT